MIHVRRILGILEFFSNRAERQIGRRSSEKKLWGCETRRMFKKVQNCRWDQTTVVCWQQTWSICLSKLLVHICYRYQLHRVFQKRLFRVWFLAILHIMFCLFIWSLSSHSIFTHMETSPLPVKGCKFWPMLGTHGHWVVRVL